MLALLLITCFAVLFPYLQTSKRVFGSYFYNVNSTFYFWCDSWEEAKAFSEASGDRLAAPSLPPEQIPSAGRYWREHSVQQIAARIAGGVLGRLRHNARFDGYYKYAALLAIAAAVLAWRRREEGKRLLRSQPFLAAFLALFFSGYLLLFGWYEPLSGDARFVLLLFLPFTFTASKLISRLAGNATLQLAGRTIPVLSAIAAVLLVLATSEAIFNAVRLANRSRAPDAFTLPAEPDTT